MRLCKIGGQDVIGHDSSVTASPEVACDLLHTDGEDRPDIDGSAAVGASVPE